MFVFWIERRSRKAMGCDTGMQPSYRFRGGMMLPNNKWSKTKVDSTPVCSISFQKEGDVISAQAGSTVSSLGRGDPRIWIPNRRYREGVPVG